MQDKYQVILAQMLKEDDNRFCVDCDTKSNIRLLEMTSMRNLDSFSWQVHDGLVGISAYLFAFVVLVSIEI